MKRDLIKKLIGLYGFIFVSFSLINISACEQWMVPNSSLRYDQITFLTSHNSYASKGYGYIYAQQGLTLEEQLEYGVRGFMLDTYMSKPLNKEPRITLCHGGSILNRLIMLGNKPLTLLDSLFIFKRFLDEHPEEVVTLFLENYVYDGQALDKVFAQAGLEDMILKPGDWDVDTCNGWPTLQWMQENNKRLVVFNSVDETRFTFYEWRWLIENQFGTLDINKACYQRKESQEYDNVHRYLYLINYIPTFKYNKKNGYVLANTIDLYKLLHRCYYYGLDNKYKYRYRIPNFINIDFVEESDILRYINMLNQRIFSHL